MAASFTSNESLRSAAGLTLLAGATATAAYWGSRATRRGLHGWYQSLRKPPYQPPQAAFAPIWTLLYAVMTCSAWRVLRRPRSAARTRALALWGTQLALNAVWPPLFFGRRRPRAAMADHILLFAAIASYTAAASKVDKPAAVMMAPYLAWVAFAGLLNEEVIRRNAHRV